jgi:hypothetical protein
MRVVVFVLCVLASLSVALLLLRAYREARTRLVLATLLCFTGITLSNAVILVDELFVDDTRLQWRGIPALLGLSALAYVFLTPEDRR